MEELYFGYPRRRKASPKRRKASPKRIKASPKRKATKKMLDSLSLEKLKKLAKKYKVSCYKKGTKVCVKKSTLLKRLKSSRSINKILLSASKMRKEKKHKRSPKRRRRLHFGNDHPFNCTERRCQVQSTDETERREDLDKLLKSGDLIEGDMVFYNPEGGYQSTEQWKVEKNDNGKLELVPQYDDDYYSDSESETISPNKRSRSRFGMKTIHPNVPNLSTPMTLSSGMTYKGMLDHYKKIPSTLLTYNMQSNGGYSAPGKSMHPPRDFRYNPRLLGTSSMPPYENISKPKNKFGQYFR